MSLVNVKDTPTKRLFERKFEFWIPRKFMLDDFDDRVSGVYQSGVPEIDQMMLNEEVPARLSIPDAAEFYSRGATLRIGDPDKNALVIFNMLLDNAEYVKTMLSEDDNIRPPSLESTQKLEAFMIKVWEVARRRLKDPMAFSGFNNRYGKLMMSRSKLGGLGRSRARSGPTAEEQLRAVRRSDFQGTKVEEIIIRRQHNRGK